MGVCISTAPLLLSLCVCVCVYRSSFPSLTPPLSHSRWVRVPLSVSPSFIFACVGRPPSLLPSQFFLCVNCSSPSLPLSLHLCVGVCVTPFPSHVYVCFLPLSRSHFAVASACMPVYVSLPYPHYVCECVSSISPLLLSAPSCSRSALMYVCAVPPSFFKPPPTPTRSLFLE